MHLMDDDVLYFLPFERITNFNLIQIEEIYQTVLFLTENKPAPLFVDLKTHIRLTSDEKSLVASKLSSCITSCAIKENNVLIRYVVHAFNYIYNPIIPIKMFKTEVDALEWLKKF